MACGFRLDAGVEDKLSESAGSSRLAEGRGGVPMSMRVAGKNPEAFVFVCPQSVLAV